MVALVANALSDGAVSVAFVLVGAATTLLTPPDLRGRVNAANAIYSSAVRGVAVIGAGALSIGGDPVLAFVVLAVCCLTASLGASRRT